MPIYFMDIAVREDEFDAYHTASHKMVKADSMEELIGCPNLIRCAEREVPHRQAVLRIRRDLVAPLVTAMNAVLPHQPFHPLLAGRKSPCP